MKTLKNFLLIISVTLLPFCGITLADDCFDTVIDKDGKTLYIDPNDKYSVFEDREKLISIYWNNIDCSGNKKTYSSDEYIDLMFNDLYKNYWEERSSQSTGTTIIEIILSILGFVAMRRIFDKAWKPWINAIIPIYNLYELSDIAWLSWFFKKALICLVLWIIIRIFIPIIGIVLIWIFVIFLYIVNYNVARNFWWSVFSSILYVVFNPVAILFLAFWNNKYYVTEQKNSIQNELSKKELEDLVNQWIKDSEQIENDVNYSDTQHEEIKIKYPENN